MPPSAIMRLPILSACSAQSITAVSWGIPMPATIRVVQIEPGPMPTFTISAPASIKSRVASAVTTLPATSGRVGYAFLTFATASTIPLECPCAESSTTISTLDLTSSATLSRTSGEPPIAAAARSLPFLSRALLGYCIDFSISLIVINPFK